MHNDLDEVFERSTYTSILPRWRPISEWPTLLHYRACTSLSSLALAAVTYQDGTFLYTDPLTVTGFWFAVECIDNGCLWASPAATSLLCGKSSAVGSDDEGTLFEVLDKTPLPDPAKDLVPLEVPAGTMVILNETPPLE